MGNFFNNNKSKILIGGLVVAIIFVGFVIYNLLSSDQYVVDLSKSDAFIPRDEDTSTTSSTQSSRSPVPAASIYPGTPKTNNAIFVLQDNLPTTMTTGQTLDVRIVMQNTGTSTWTPLSSSNPTGHRLSSQNPTGNINWGFDRINLPVASVAPNSQVAFAFKLKAPSTPGTYDFVWQMVQEGVEFFGPLTPLQKITVVAPSTTVTSPTPSSGPAPTPYPPQACQLNAPGYTVFDFGVNQYLCLNGSGGCPNQRGPYGNPSTLQPGKYEVKLQSYDAHQPMPPGTGDQNQLHERYYIKLTNSSGTEIARSNPIADLPNGQNDLVGTVNSSTDPLIISSAPTNLYAVHYSAGTTAESIDPRCAAFKYLGPLNTTTPTPSTTSTPTPTVTPTPTNTKTPTPTVTPTPTITVTPTPTITPFPLSCSPSNQTVGQGYNVSIYASGGTGSYSWTSANGNPSSATGSSYTTNYSSLGSQTVTLNSGGNSVNCFVNVNQNPTPTPSPVLSLQMDKLVRDITRGDTIEQQSTTTSPEHRLEFTIRVKSLSNTSVNNVVVRDVMPSRITYVSGSTTVDGSSVQDGVVSGGIVIGSLNPGQEKIVRFQGNVAVASQFTSTSTRLINSGFVRADNISEFEDQTPIDVLLNPITPPTGLNTYILALLIATIVTGGFVLVGKTSLSFATFGVNAKSFVENNKKQIYITIFIIVFASSLMMLLNQSRTLEISLPASSLQPASLLELLRKGMGN